MELMDTSKPAEVSKVGDDIIEMSAGKKLTIETSPEGEEILITDEVPEGKKWRIRILVDINETDVE